MRRRLPANTESHRTHLCWRVTLHPPADVCGRRTSFQCSRSCSSWGSTAAERPRFWWSWASSCSTWGSRSTEQHTCQPSLRRTSRGTRWTPESKGTCRSGLPSAPGAKQTRTIIEDLPRGSSLPYKWMTLRQWRHFLKLFQTDVFEENTGRRRKPFSWEDYVHGQPGAGSENTQGQLG